MWFELGPVEPRRRADHVGDVEPGDRLGVGEDLVVAVAPAQPGQVVAHGLGQIAHVGELADRLRAVALGELGAVRPVDQRQVGEAPAGPSPGA